MKYYLTTKFYTGQEALIKLHGDKLWEELCDECNREVFTIGQLIDRLPMLKHLAWITQRQYLRVILNNVFAGQDRNNPVLTRLSIGRWSWAT